MQFFKTSYELLAPEYLPFIGHRDDIYALTPHFSRKKHYFARYFEQSREKKQKGKKKKKQKSEKIFQETSQSKYITTMAASQWVVYPPLFSSLFFTTDFIRIHARVCRFQYNATEIIRPIVMKRKWKKFRISIVERGTERSSVYFSPRKFFLLSGSQIFYTRRGERETSLRWNVKTRSSNDFNIT